MRGELATVLGAVTAATAAPVTGKYATSHKTYTYDGMDKTSKIIDVWYPKRPAGSNVTFPLISYAHGLGGGGLLEYTGYNKLLGSTAAFGYVIAATRACNTGCKDDKVNLPKDPPGFGHYYMQQLEVLEWARDQAKAGDATLSLIDPSAPAGVAGHSMGGQATVYSSSSTNPGAHNIKAAVMHHAYTHSYPAPVVPFLAMTGAKDTTAPPAMAEGFFNAKGAAASRGLANKQSATHHEPDITDYNPLVPQWTAAWFKIFLDGTPQADGVDFDALIFGKGAGSICGGGDGEMAACTMLRGK